MVRITLFACALLMWCGCASMRDPGALDVGIVDVVSGESTVWESSLVFTVRLSNASPEPMILEGASHKIYFNGSYVGLGLSNERVEVPRLGTTTQAVTVRVRNLTMLKKVLEMAEGQSSSVDYRVNSTFYGSGTFGRRVSATKEGSLDLGKLGRGLGTGVR